LHTANVIEMMDHKQRMLLTVNATIRLDYTRTRANHEHYEFKHDIYTFLYKYDIHLPLKIYDIHLIYSVLDL